MAIFNSYDGTRLWYDTFGTGPALVALPGGPGMDARYLGDLGGLDAGRTVIRLHPRASGRSEAPEDRSGCSFAEQARDVEALRRHLGLDRFDLLGHSAGALTAQRYAAEHPDRVRRLVLVTPVGRAAREPDEDELAALRAARSDEPWYPDAAAAVAELRLGGGDPAELARRMTPFFWGSWTEEIRQAAFDPGLAPAPAWLRAEFYASAGAGAPRPVRVPVLAVAGGRDGLIGTAPARLAADCHPRGRLEVLARAGHRPWVDRPEEFRALVGAFLYRPADDRPTDDRPADNRPTDSRPDAGRPDAGRPDAGRPDAGQAPVNRR
ncbi:alpha/beta hydrolase [Kitasatospora sp. NPDC049258]|uniref:alpha/beta fold hydrolase n=1 Tax=Kitasatospora sp. NPDC049258 TaxID=3155394 RepID=UPI0034316AFB